MTTASRERTAHPLVLNLEELVRKEDRAALAHLRRALGKPVAVAHEAHRHVLPWLPAREKRWEQERDEDAAYLVASLFALWHQGKDRVERAAGDRPANLGTSFRRLPEDRRTDSVEKRFRALLNAHRDDLPDHLRHAVSMLRPHAECALDWSQLLRDIRGWDAVNRRVQRDWARGYWGVAASEPATGDQTSVDASTSDA